MRAREKARLARIAAMPFDPIPGAEAIGDRAKWGDTSETFRTFLVVAGSILAKDPRELSAAALTMADPAGLAEWGSMMDRLKECAARARTMAELFDAASARALIAMAAAAQREAA